MLSMAWQAIRTRPASFAGTLIALTLGIALTAASGLVIMSPQHGPDAQAYAETSALLTLMAGISAFACVFVVSGTFALSISQRRRELALLRVVGATPRQIRRMLMAEAFLVGLLAAVIGCVFALPVAYAAIAFLRSIDVITPNMTITVHPVPLILALVVGLIVAQLGVWFAARRTRRIRPVEALRQAAVELKAMTFSRWAIGVIATAAGVVMLFAMAGTGSEDRLTLALLVGEVLVIGATGLAPVIIPMIVGLAGAMLGRNATAEVAQANLRTQARRAASVAAPVLLITGVAGSLFAATSSLGRTVVNEEAARTIAEVVIVPSQTPGLPEDVAQIASTVDGVAAVAPIGDTHVFAPDEFSTHVLPANAISSGAMRLDVREGDLNELRGDSFAASYSFAAQRNWRTGDIVPMRLEDGSEARLRLVATVDGGISGGYIFVPADRFQGHLEPWSTRYALVKLEPGADPGAVREALAANGLTAVARDEWLSRVGAAQAEGVRIGLTAVLGMAGLYVAIAIVNTLIMAVRERAQDLALMRLAGATTRQALRILLWEGGLVALSGIALGALVTGITMVAMQVALRTASATAQADLPWSMMIGIAAICAVLVLLTSLITGAIALRRPPLDTLAIPE